MPHDILGRGRFEELSGILSGKGIKSVLLFRGKSSFNRISERVGKVLGTADVSEYCDFDTNPKMEQISEALKLFKGRKFDAIIAIGGGSVIDFAKGFKYYSGLSIPIWAVPTTAGTGSEATQFAVIYISGKKTSIESPDLLPDISVVDASFLDGASAYLKASTAADALSQAIESYWSINSAEESKLLAKRAIDIAKKYLVDYVNSDSRTAADNMAECAHLAGKAINITRTTAAHALSYKITSAYSVPHGHAVALCLSEVFKANGKCEKRNCNDPRGAEYVRVTMLELTGMFGLKSPDEFPLYWKNLMSKIGLETDMAKLGITDTADIIRSVNTQRLKNNPKDISEDMPLFWK